jgi:hypothetical protein
MHQSLLFEAGEDVADCGRGQTKVTVLGQPGRGHGFPLLDVFAHEPGENAALSFRRVGLHGYVLFALQNR